MNLKKIISKIPSWPILANIGNNKLVVSSYIWIIIIPIAAKFLEHFPSVLLIKINDNDLSLGLILPFQWKILYFSALSFALATFIYHISCPNLIKNFSDMNHFKEKGLTKVQLINFLSTWLRTESTPYDASGTKMEKTKLIQKIHDEYCENTITEALINSNLDKSVKTFKIKEEEEINAYWFIRTVMSNDRLWIRIIITILYCVGFSLLLYLLIENIYSVIKI